MFSKSMQAIALSSAMFVAVSSPQALAEENDRITLAFGSEYDSYALKLEGGVSQASLPEYLFGVDLSGAGFSTGSRINTSEDNLDGYQFGGTLYLPSMDIGGRDVILGLSGSYSGYSGDDVTVCDTATGAAFCNLFPLFESGPGAFDLIKNTFAGGITFDSEREVDVIEFALKAKTPGPIEGSNFGFGFDYKRFAEDYDLAANVFEPADPSSGTASYNHDLDTDYYGVFISMDNKQNLSEDLTVIFDGKVGIYQRDTDYTGNFFSDQRDFAAAPITQTLGLSDDGATVIAEGKLELVRMFGNTKVSGFVKGQWFGDVATINYNDTDTAPTPVGGSQVGTTLGTDSAFTVTFGGSIVIPF